LAGGTLTQGVVLRDIGFNANDVRRLKMTTPYEVLDTAVKIGLGAIISGIVTYVMFKLNKNQERVQRRRELLEDVSKHVANVDRAGLRYWHALNRAENLPDYASDAQSKIDNIIEEVSVDSTTVQATLWLLGENRCCELFKNYENAVWNYPDHALATEEEFQKAREPMRNKRM
jgi:hypothetical protein